VFENQLIWLSTQGEAFGITLPETENCDLLNYKHRTTLQVIVQHFYSDGHIPLFLVFSLWSFVVFT